MRVGVRQPVLALVLLGALSCHRSTDASVSPARREAQRLYLKGMDHVMRLEYAAATAAMRAALVADPGYLPALADFTLESGHSPRTAAKLDTVAALAADPGLARCLMRAAASHRGVTAALPPAPRRESTASRWCSFFMRYVHERPQDAELVLDSIQLLTGLYPEWQYLSSLYFSADRTLERSEVVREAARALKRSRLHPAPRALRSAALANALHEIGDDSGAMELERAVMRDPSWALPGFRTVWASQIENHARLRVLSRLPDPTVLGRHVDSTLAMITAIRRSALEAGDQRARLSIQVSLGVEALDRGRLGEAVTLLNAAVPLADSIDDTGLRTYLRMRLGRALVKAGQSPDAERILLAARASGDSAGIPRVQKEVEHNLLHLYESLGRDDDALRAGEAFVWFASAATVDPVRMMSARDVGLFLRARGRLEESRRYFERMLADIDSLGQEEAYAGEYYEMTGALDNALAQYRKGVTRAVQPTRSLAGLVRVALAMGDTAGARRWAASHDARRNAAGAPEATPLLPAVLWRSAGGDAARPAFLRAREEVARHSQVSAWASLTADLAMLEHETGQLARAEVLADSARDAARRVGAVETLLRARGIAASARARRGSGAEAGMAIRALVVAAVEADRVGDVLLRADLHRLVAGALVSAGRWREALAEFQRAAVPLDSVAGRIAMDPGQAAFRSAQRRAYDDALAAIVRHASQRGAVDAYVAWSARRKGRTYAVRLPVDGDLRLPRMSPGTAIVDYVLLDTLVAALVVTSQGSRIVPLDVRPRQVRSDAEALRRAVDVRVGSSLDVRRAHFPLEVAHRLYRAVLAPLEAHLSGVTTLIVVPDGILSLVPFDALVTRMPAGPDDDVRFVLDERVVVNATTIHTDPSAWRLMPDRVAVIDPGTAPAAAIEVDAITKALTRNVVALRGPAATRANSIAAMDDADIVHFIAHAEANEHDPGSSRIDLSPDEGDDGRLDASQVAALRLDAPLVVLSACETANGRVLDGEGVLSISRSFLRAGARATVATLWPVGPSAADFAAAFYAHVARSRDAAEALSAAKRRMRANGAPPSAWAPYELFVAPSSGRASSSPVVMKGQERVTK